MNFAQFSTEYELVAPLHGYPQHFITRCNNIFSVRKNGILVRQNHYGHYEWQVHGKQIRSHQIGMELSKEEFVELLKDFPKRHGHKSCYMGVNEGTVALYNNIDEHQKEVRFYGKKRKQNCVNQYLHHSGKLPGYYIIISYDKL